MEAVENQLRNNDPPQTQQTYKRLLAAGHSTKVAKQLIGAVVASEIFDVLKNPQPFNLTVSSNTSTNCQRCPGKRTETENQEPTCR